MRRSSAGGDYDTRSMTEALERVAADYPEMRADLRGTVSMDPAAARAMAFDFALLCMLDGLAARLVAAGTPPAAEPERAQGFSAPSGG